LVSILNKQRLDISLGRLVAIAQDNFGSNENTHREVEAFLERRVRFLLQKEGVSYDILNAVFAVGIETVHDASDRARALEEIRGETDFEALTTAYKRIKNILVKQRGELSPLKPELLAEPEEEELYIAYEQLQPTVLKWIKERDYLEALRAMAGVRAVVDRFFDKVLVMAKDVEIRSNRLALLDAVSNVFVLIADISEIVQEGEQNG
jgi:glycyl-tRNA synthetase beta chain